MWSFGGIQETFCEGLEVCFLSNVGCFMFVKIVQLQKPSSVHGRRCWGLIPFISCLASLDSQKQDRANIFYAYTANDLKELNKNDLIVIFPRKNTNFIMTCLNTVNLSVLKLFSEMQEYSIHCTLHHASGFLFIKLKLLFKLTKILKALMKCQGRKSCLVDYVWDYIFNNICLHINLIYMINLRSFFDLEV